MPEIISTVILIGFAAVVVYMEFVSPKEQKHRRERTARKSVRFERRSLERGDRRLRERGSYVGHNRRLAMGRRASDKERFVRVLESAPVAAGRRNQQEQAA